MNARSISSILIWCAGLTGCCFGGGDSAPSVTAPAPTAPASPPAAALRDTPGDLANDLTTTDEPRAGLSIYGSRVTLFGPAGTTGTMDGQTWTVPAGETRVVATIDTAPYLLGIGVEVRPGSGSTLPDLRNHSRVQRQVSITRPGLPPAEGMLTIDNAGLLRMFTDRFATVREGGVSIAPEGTRSAAIRLTVSDVVILDGVQGTVMAPGDVGVVAIVEQARRTGSCGTYVNARGGTEQIPWFANDSHVTLYERPTGRVIAERTFSASRPRCARSVRTSPQTYADRDAVTAFIDANMPDPATMAAATVAAPSATGAPAVGSIAPSLTMAEIQRRITPLCTRVSVGAPSDTYGYVAQPADLECDGQFLTIMLASLVDGDLGDGHHAYAFGEQSFVQVTSYGDLARAQALARDLGSPASEEAFVSALASHGLQGATRSEGMHTFGDALNPAWDARRDGDYVTIRRYDLTLLAAFGREGRSMVMISPMMGLQGGPRDTLIRAAAARLLAALR